MSMRILVSVTSPVLVKLPEMNTSAPKGTGLVTQDLLSLKLGVRTFEQVAEQVEVFVLVYGPVAKSVPPTNMVSLIGAHILALE